MGALENRAFNSQKALSASGVYEKGLRVELGQGCSNSTEIPNELAVLVGKTKEAL